jgi:glycosyltransferase involved in cell wall biosynthesis
MRGVVIESDRNRGVGYARNTGWRAAGSEWIQFLDADDLLASDKLERQMKVIANSPDDVAVVCSSWQRLTRKGEGWQPSGPVVSPELDRSVILRIVTINAGFLGPALIRRRALESVSGFSEHVKYAEDSHLMLKIAAAGGVFVDTPCASPMFLIRQTPGSKSRNSWSKVARQHMENMVVAERMLRDRNFGEVSGEDAKEIGRLSGWAVSELYERDPAAFRQYLEWIRDVDPTFVPQHSAKLRLASQVLGYENAEGVASVYRRLRTWLGGIAASYATRPAAGSGKL